MVTSKLPSFNSYEEGTLKGTYEAYTKLDGVCVLINQEEKTALSKRGKPLYNFELIFKLPYQFPTGYYEVYSMNWDTTVSMVRTKDGIRKVQPFHLYPIFPVRCDKLRIGNFEDPEEELLKELLEEELALGHEGIVLWPVEGTRSKKPI